MGVKISATIPQEMEKEILRIAARLERRKGATVVYLIELARDNPDTKRCSFNGGNTSPCAVSVSQSTYDSFKPYREKHGLAEKASFLRDALARGISADRSTREN